MIHMHPHTIIFIGSHGSGKGTQLEKLDATLRAQDVSRRVVAVQTGRLFRSLAQKEETYTGKHLNETLNTGIWQPDFLTTTLLGNLLIAEVDPLCHMLIDGFPRTLAQAKVLEGALDFYMRKNVMIVSLNASDEVVRARMKDRARPDDTDEVIEKRLRLYNQETPQVLDFYRARADTTVLDIDGAGTIEAIHETIAKHLGLVVRTATEASAS